MFQWNRMYSVGVPSLDAQHQNLFRIAQELYDAMSAGQGKSMVGRVLDRLIQYTSAHFAHEERLMRQSDYPLLEEHQLEHAKLTAQVLEFQKNYRSGTATLTVQLLHFLKKWLEHHIQESDQAFGSHLRVEQAIPPAAACARP